MDEKFQYENIIRKLEAKERLLTKIKFMNNLQKEAMENKIGDYMEMEDEFEEMKTKLKYEDGRFLNNDRKENEIIIIRGENSNLKKSIKILEQQIINLEKDKQEKTKIIDELQESMKKFKVKFKDLQKENEILNSHSINININNVIGTNNKTGLSNNNFKYENNNSKNKDKEKNKIFPYHKIKDKLLNKKHNEEILSNTRNASLEKSNSNLLNKYLIVNRIYKNNNHLNNSCVKMNHYSKANNQKQNFFNNSSSHKPFNRNNMKSFNVMKKMMYSGGNNNNNRACYTKLKGKSNKITNYSSIS